MSQEENNNVDRGLMIHQESNIIVVIFLMGLIVAVVGIGLRILFPGVNITDPRKGEVYVASINSYKACDGSTLFYRHDGSNNLTAIINSPECK